MQMSRTSFIQIMCVGDRIRLHLTLYYRVIAIYHPYAVHCIRHVWSGKHVYSRKRLLYHQEQFCTCQHWNAQFYVPWKFTNFYNLFENFYFWAFWHETDFDIVAVSIETPSYIKVSSRRLKTINFNIWGVKWTGITTIKISNRV